MNVKDLLEGTPTILTTMDQQAAGRQEDHQLEDRQAEDRQVEDHSEIQTHGSLDSLEGLPFLEAEDPLEEGHPEDLNLLRIFSKDLKIHHSSITTDSNSRRKSRFLMFQSGTEMVILFSSGSTNSTIWHTKIKAYIMI